MLFHTLLAPGSGIYLMQNRYRIDGPVAEQEFAAAFRAVLARHPILRTSFAWKSQKRPLQVVHKQVELPFVARDLRALGAAQQEAEISAELARELQTGLDFGKAPLMRFRLFRLGDTSYELVHSFHHILLDEWCTSLLMMDFTQIYEALIAGGRAEPAPARPYRDYIDWLQRQDSVKTEAFWRAYLCGIAGPTSLGIELLGGAEDSDTEDLACALDATATATLHALAQRHRLTLNTFVQGAWALLLSRYSGDPEVLFGITVAGRPPDLPQVDAILGLFINTLPLRVRVPLEQRLVPWLAALQAQNLELRQYEHTPLVDIQRWSEIERGQEMFQSLFVFENAPIDPALRAGRSFRVREVRDRVHTNYPVTVMAWPDQELGLKISYDRGRVPHAAATRMLAQLRTLLAGMAARPDARLGELAMLSAAERARALNEWNETGDRGVEFGSYAARFQEQVRHTPHAVAARCLDSSITYRDLHRASNRVACMLRAAGVGPEDRVALVDERGIELLTAMVGVLKAGAAYVPTEPSYPPARLAEIVRLSTPRVVLTRAPLRSRVADALCSLACAAPSPLGAPRKPRLMTLEDVTSGAASEADLDDSDSANALAYVIFTSGSTGVPKGVMVERAGMLNNMLSKIPCLGLEPSDVIAQTASSCFDISVWQHLTALLFGGTVEIIPDDIARDPVRLLEQLERSEVTVVELVPAVLQGLLDAARERGEDGALLRRLRWVLPTGEALPVALARSWLARFPGVGLMNAYGPAECSDDVALHAITTAAQLDATSVPIGRPVDHLRLYVIDQALEPLPVGVTGELYVGGLGVGRGYLGDPRRTAQAFLPDPFSERPGCRLYRTGDLARYRADGALEFVGRRDSQVKLRGLRIELGEIEARLTDHPQTREAAVLVREDRPGARQLVAYVASDAAEDDLRAFLRTRLPDYMVPARFVFLPALPRSANGKIDRKTLPAPELGSASTYLAPRGPHEQKLAAIWAEILELPEVGVEDSFFSLGGHSLQLTQVLARVRKAFDVEVPLRSLFEAPTVAAQAQAIVAAQHASPRSAARPLAVVKAEGPAPLSFAQERLWFLAQLEPGAAAYNVPVVVRLSGKLDVARLRGCFSALAQRHDVLRTRFVELAGTAGTLADVAAPELGPPLDLDSLPEPRRLDQARSLLEAEAARPFDLRRGPLVRLLLVRLGAEEHLLSIVLHHAISDGWSLGVMVRELGELYAAAAEARSPRLPPLPIQYADYARWQRQSLLGATLDQQLAYWRDRLNGSVHSLALPLDRARPALRSYQGARHPFELSPALQASVQGVARQRGMTPYVVLLTAFQLLLARLSGQAQFLVGTPVANRGREELEGLIGFFVNTLVLRAELADDPSFATALERVRQEWLGAQAHQELPFERLVQAIQPKRDLGQTPLFQVMFSLQERDQRPSSVHGIELSAFEIDPKSAQFDLSLHMALDDTGLSGFFEYSTEVLGAASITRLSHAFHHLLEAVLARPTLRLSELPFPAWPRPVVAAGVATLAATPVCQADSLALSTLAEIEARLAQIWADTLGRDGVDADDNFFALGGDSILSLDLVARARRANLRLSVHEVFRHQTLRELARAVALRTLLGEAGDEGPVTGPTPLLPIQRRFFAKRLPNPNHWNQSLLLICQESLEPGPLTEAIRALLHHHDALRLRFTLDADDVRASHAAEEQGTFVHHTDLGALPPERRTQALEAHAGRWQASLDLAAGPLLRAVIFDLGPGEPTRLLLVAHHLVVDGVSWRILLSDLEVAYDQARGAAAIELPERTTSFKRWAERLAAAADEPALQREAQIWLQLPFERAVALSLDDPDGDRSEAALALHEESLSAEETRALLEAVPRAYRTRVEEALLAALALALRPRLGSPLAIELEGHGRELFEGEELDLSRTVGWLTSAYPVLIQLSDAHGPGAALTEVKEQLRRLPRRGLAYGVVRELGHGEIAEQLRAQPTPSVGFNYLGQWDSVMGSEARFRPAETGYGAEHDPRGGLAYELEIDAAIYQGQLGTTFRFSSARLRPETVAAVARAYSAELSRLIAHCLAPEVGAYTPSDFPEVALSATELGAILEQVD